jgi:hypothetical protein
VSSAAERLARLERQVKARQQPIQIRIAQFGRREPAQEASERADATKASPATPAQEIEHHDGAHAAQEPRYVRCPNCATLVRVAS